MAGNHRPRRPQYGRLVLCAFAAAACWISTSAWRPASTPGPVERTLSSTRQIALADMLRGGKAPSYRWLAVGRSHTVPHLREAIRFTASPDLPKVTCEPLDERIVDLRLACDAPEWMDHRHSLELAGVPVDRLLEPIHPQAARLTVAMSSVDWSHPAWQLCGEPTTRGYGTASVAILRRWHADDESTFAPPTRRYASPPSLIGGPVLTDADDRLAMLPRNGSVDTSTVAGRGWHDRLLESVRPHLATSLDSTLSQPLGVMPESLVAMLRKLALHPYCSEWAMQTLATVDALSSGRQHGVMTTTDLLMRLAYYSECAETLAKDARDPGVATQLRRARYAVWRRVEVWRAVEAMLSPPVERIALASNASNGTDAKVTPIEVRTPLDVDAVLAAIERFESSPSSTTSGVLADRVAQLFDSPNLRRQALAETVSVHYRNANARLAVTDDLVNRFMPVGKPQVEAIRDRVLGTPVRGQATLESAAKVSLIADPSVWRIGLELSGQADSQTVALERTVRVRTAGTTRFAARQQVVFDAERFRMGAVVADANSASRFIRASSDFDPLPLVGNIVRNRAANAFSNRRRRAEYEVAAKTEQRVQQQMEEAVRDAVNRASEQWQIQVAAPLAAGGVSIEPVELRTTSERLIARVRLVHGDSLAAHTPRPRAPSDSLASCQLHESAFTNVAQALDLEGQRLTAQEFVDRLRRFAPRLADQELDADAREVEIEFADGVPVTFELVDNQLHLAWDIRELVVRGRANRNFKVHVYYAADANGVVAHFNHEKGPYLEGDMRNSQRMRLQTIFGKVFPPGGQVTLGEEYADDPRLAGLMITQLVIDDGWLGVALGPKQPGRTAQLDRYAPVR